VVCYVDSTIALPLLTAYAMKKVKARKPKRLYDQRVDLVKAMTAAAKKKGNL
jgi:deoxyhypusine synthase